MRNVVVFSLLLFYPLIISSQTTPQKSSGEIYEELRKFNFLGSVLYVAAHPDDENTRLISCLSNGLHARTGYLSLTRGDGGQNLIGTEISELLGVLRIQELQMARKVDGGIQFFTRANDFGYSKHPEETLRIWDKEKVLDDVVRVIRTFRPDVIINRFDHRTPGRTHGHHTSSAVLSLEAFELAGDPSSFSYQLKELEPWQTHRIFFNTSWWFYGSREKFEEADRSLLMSLEVGAYYPLLGISNNEISGLARSKHRSQGFGSAGARGSYQEYLELIKGDMPENKEDLFEGINTNWTRVKGGAAIDAIMENILANYDFKDPTSILPNLMEIYNLLENIEDDHWREVKKKELISLIRQVTGLFIELSSDTRQSTHGDSIELEIELTNRSDTDVKFISYSILDSNYTIEEEIEPFTENKWFRKYYISDNVPFSNPYWLEEDSPEGTYNVREPYQRITPESGATISGIILLEINGTPLTFTTDVIYRTVDPSVGEIRQPFVVLPPATMSFDKDLYLFSNLDQKKIEVKVRASGDSLMGTLSLHVPDNWKVQPSSVDISIPNKSMEKSYEFILNSPAEIDQDLIEAEFRTGGKVYSKSLTEIDYDHIPLQTVLLPARAKIVKVPLNTGGRNIGYIMGAGDKMPESLEDVSYNVELIELYELDRKDLSVYDAIILGIRAYNTEENLWLYNDKLFEYAYNGGTLITQYNTSRNLNYEKLAPYPIELSRNRISDETAELRIINPGHPVVNRPNKITSRDFEGWVQERGLYFPESWDKKYESILSGHDPGEEELTGSLLIAPHGEGFFVYTTLSWFRQLPAGVPGSYRLFANILALSSTK